MGRLHANIDRRVIMNVEQCQSSPPTLPASPQGLLVLIGGALTRGGHVMQDMRTSPFGGDSTHEPQTHQEPWAVCDHRITTAREELARDAASRLPALCAVDEPASVWIRIALLEAVVVGMDIYRIVLGRLPLHGSESKRCNAVISADPEWLHVASEGLLYRLLDSLDLAGIHVPGAADALRMMRDYASTPPTLDALAIVANDPAHWIEHAT